MDSDHCEIVEVEASCAGERPHAGCVELWQVSLDVDAELQSQLADLLSADEHATAERFVFEPRRRAYIAARGALRSILASYLECDPRSIRFSYGPHGKPELTTPSQDLHFNVSHSGELAIIAVASSAVGVDIEPVSAKASLEMLAKRLFSAADLCEWRELAQPHQSKAFYQSWTWKEAYTKAVGTGLARATDGFNLQLARGLTTALPICWHDSLDTRHWKFAQFVPAPGFVGTVVIEADSIEPRLRSWQWNLHFATAE